MEFVVLITRHRCPLRYLIRCSYGMIEFSHKNKDCSNLILISVTNRSRIWQLFTDHRSHTGNQKPCTANRNLSWKNLQEVPRTADTAFIFCAQAVRTLRIIEWPRSKREHTLSVLSYNHSIALSQECIIVTVVTKCISFSWNQFNLHCIVYPTQVLKTNKLLFINLENWIF